MGGLFSGVPPENIAFIPRQPLVALSIAQRENSIEILSHYSITSIVKNCFKHSDYLDKLWFCSAELRESRLAEAEEAMVKSKQKMQQDAKQNMLDTYSMKYSASSKSESYHESSVTTTTTEWQWFCLLCEKLFETDIINLLSFFCVCFWCHVKYSSNTYYAGNENQSNAQNDLLASKIE